MFFYAEINEQNVCTGVKAVPEEMHFDNHIPIETMDFEYMWKKYENGKWSEEKFLPDAGAIQLSRMEKLEQSQDEQNMIIQDLILGGL